MTRNAAFEEEKESTKATRADLIRYLSHDTSPTRLQLIQVLRERIEMIEVEISTDSIFSQFKEQRERT